MHWKLKFFTKYLCHAVCKQSPVYDSCIKSNILLLGVSKLTALYLLSGAFPKTTFVCEKITQLLVWIQDMRKYMKLLQGKFPYTHAEVYLVKPQIQFAAQNQYLCFMAQHLPTYSDISIYSPPVEWQI